MSRSLDGVDGIVATMLGSIATEVDEHAGAWFRDVEAVRFGHGAHR